MYYILTGVAFAIVFFVYYGEVTLRAIRGLYNTNIARSQLAHAFCAISNFYGSTLFPFNASMRDRSARGTGMKGLPVRLEGTQIRCSIVAGTVSP